MELLHREVSSRRSSLQSQAVSLQNRAARKEAIARELENLRVAYNANPCDRTELDLHRALLRSKQH